MPNYFEVQGVFNLLSAANQMRSQGETLREELAGLMRDIEAAERDPGTFPPDKFTQEFLKTYHSEQEGASGPANEAVRTFVAGTPGSEDEVGLGGMLVQFGEVALNAMWTYSATDDASGGNIRDVEA